MTENLADKFIETSELHPEKEAIQYKAEGAWHITSYAELNKAAAALSGFLLKEGILLRHG